MDVELDPEQPPEVTQAVEELLADEKPEPDPWWRAGLEETLET